MTPDCKSHALWSLAPIECCKALSPRPPSSFSSSHSVTLLHTSNTIPGLLVITFASAFLRTTTTAPSLSTQVQALKLLA
ncbi:hypothetical protein KCV07_g65, partial [Aureobasidium melanogenum]